MPGQIIFITGAARSAKSRLAESLARSHGGRVAYVPTAQVTDTEMRRRVSIHRTRRPSEWDTVECPASLAEALETASVNHDVILVDCLTVYLSRLLPMIAGDILPAQAEAEAETRMEAELRAIVDTIRAHEAAAIIVSNEVGWGVVPAFPAGRLYRDLVGRANQHLVQAADFAYLVVAGVPLDLKSLAARNFPWHCGGG